MPVPQVDHVLNGWVTFVTIKHITQEVVNYEVTEVVSESSYSANFQPMSPQAIQRMPAEYRGRKLWTVIVKDSKVYFDLNDIIEDPDGNKYRIHNSKDWRSSGYTEYGTELDYDQQ